MTQVNSVVQLGYGSSIISVSPGEETVIAGQTVSVEAGGSRVVVDGSRTIPLTSAAMLTQVPTVIALSARQTLSLVDASGSVEVLLDGSTAFVGPSQETVISGQTVSAAETSGEVGVDGTKTVEVPQPLGTNVAAVVTASDGVILSIFATNSQVEVVAHSTTLLLTLGQATVLSGQTISAASGNSDLAVIGSRTITRDPPATSSSGYGATAPRSSDSQNSPQTTAAVSASKLRASLEVFVLATLVAMAIGLPFLI